jgi:FkbM family methyltransferase
VTIYDHWRRILNETTDPVVLEVGVHHATSTVALRACATAAGKAMRWLGIEPDPRNAARCRELGFDVVEAAASDQAGTATLRLSSGFTPGYQGRLHTDSSSLQVPTKHLERHPWCQFQETAVVQTVRIDDLVPLEECVTLLWADVQGGQRRMIEGAREVLSRTSYLYIECHSEPLYAGEPSRDELRELLPGWSVVEMWDDDILFQRNQ